MAVELACKRLISRPWGVADLSPWDGTPCEAPPIGEIRFGRPGEPNEDPALLLKLLFTSEPLSIQVHPDDAYAQAIGEANGKTEAWYVLAAAPGAKIALGLNDHRTPQELRQAVEDGSLSALVAWRQVTENDVAYVPAGTIHALGPGLVIAEIQQRSDTTFRLYDHGRHRQLHIEQAIAVAHPGPAQIQAALRRLTDERSLLVSCPHFVFERIDLAKGTAWCLDAMRETWILILRGGAVMGSFEVAKGDAVFAQSDRVKIQTGELGLSALVAYTGADGVTNLLQRDHPSICKHGSTTT